MVKASAKGCRLRVWPMPSSKKIPAFFAVRLSRGKGAWFVFFHKNPPSFCHQKKFPESSVTFDFSRETFVCSGYLWSRQQKVSKSIIVMISGEGPPRSWSSLGWNLRGAPGPCSQINRLLKIGRQDGWFINTRGTTLYLLVHVQFGHEINFTVALKNLNFSKDQTVAHFEDFSIYQHISDSRASPPLWTFLSGMQENPNPKSDWWTNPLRNNFDCIHHYCETPLLFEWNLPPNWSIKLILVGWWFFFHFKMPWTPLGWFHDIIHLNPQLSGSFLKLSVWTLDHLGPPKTLQWLVTLMLSEQQVFSPERVAFFFYKKNACISKSGRYEESDFG